MTNKQIKARLEYLRGEIEAERISYGEIAELQTLVDYIEKDDVVLLEWAGVPEFEDNEGKINTDNHGWLKTKEGFELLRGIENKDKLMGLAEDKEGNVYEIFTAPCNIGTCYCWATAKPLSA